MQLSVLARRVFAGFWAKHLLWEIMKNLADPELAGFGLCARWLQLRSCNLQNRP